ncbi:membrane fusion protein, multidrug efflux system [Nitrosovibrio sp. Nv17]|nr:efflux RND transporter periplasmic adaptor subunit [Nitrosovibrio sp. Nv17]SFW24877.1 membrane fusion protein, multidrug efflux system [Nitrosovibrio sp. Nv17]
MQTLNCNGKIPALRASWGQLAGMLMVTTALGACNNSGGAGDQAAPPALPVSVIEVQPTRVPISVEAVAQTEGAKEVEIRPRVGGILLKRLYEEGTEVRAGQPMFRIDPVPYEIALTQARAQLVEQKARIEQARREEKRLHDLLGTQAISQREHDNAVSDRAIMEAALQQAEARVRDAERNLSYTTVTAPVDGVSGRFQFSEGALVEANESLLTTLAQLSPIWVRFSLSDHELAQLGGPLTEKGVRQVVLILPDGTEYDRTGVLNFAASQIDPTLGTQQLRATFENPDRRLLPGQFVRARVVTGEREGVFLVPQVAVQTSDLGKSVYVVGENNEAAVRPVEAGHWIGKDWVILGGLRPGDRVIVDNLIKLRPGMAVSPQPHADPSAAPPPSAQISGDRG